MQVPYARKMNKCNHIIVSVSISFLGSLVPQHSSCWMILSVYIVERPLRSRMIHSPRLEAISPPGPACLIPGCHPGSPSALLVWLTKKKSPAQSSILSAATTLQWWLCFDDPQSTAAAAAMPLNPQQQFLSDGCKRRKLTDTAPWNWAWHHVREVRFK